MEMSRVLPEESPLRPSCRGLWKDFPRNAFPRETRRAETVPEITVCVIIFCIYIDQGL